MGRFLRIIALVVNFRQANSFRGLARIGMKMEEEGLVRGDSIKALGELSTRLTHTSRPSRAGGANQWVNPPVQRGSTVTFASVKDRMVCWSRRFEQELVYGICGTETHFALENLIVDVEGGTRCQITSSGLSACTIALMAFLSAGDHALIPDAVYGPVRSFATYLLSRFNVEVTYYDMTAPVSEIEVLFRPNTKVLYIESPGSHTFEMCDVAQLSDLAHQRGAKTLFDNTWGIHFFRPFEKGRVDVSIQALTKYVVGHSDALLGSIVTNDDRDWRRVRDTALGIGEVASPDDCWLALRGARTLAVRLEHQMKAGLEVAQWLASRPEVLKVLHPGLPGTPDYELYRRDYTGCPSLFGVIFQPQFSSEALFAMLESLQLFAIGASWGGYESLALPTTGGIVRTMPGAHERIGGPMARFHVGLEGVEDLIKDLEKGLAVLRAYKPSGREEGQA